MQGIEAVGANALDVENIDRVPPQDAGEVPANGLGGESVIHFYAQAAFGDAHGDSIDGDSFQDFFARQISRPAVGHDDHAHAAAAVLQGELAAEFFDAADVGEIGTGEDCDVHAFTPAVGTTVAGLGAALRGSATNGSLKEMIKQIGDDE